MSLLLDIAYALAALLTSPFILFKMVVSERWRAGFRQRFGGVPVREGKRPCVWIHAVSVGEVNAARRLIELMESHHPDWDIRVSTITNTGQRLARELFGDIRCFYFPLDFSFAVKRALRRVRPDAIVLVELELWPNFLRAARKAGIPVIVVNGRMRAEKVSRYRRARFLFSPAMRPENGNLFCVQNETYRDRFERAGVPAETIRVTGNMKYDALRTETDPEKVAALREALGIGPAEPVWAAGCTWPGEEDICLRVHSILREQEPALRLVIAPRHIERAAEVERAVRASGYRPRRRTAPNDLSGPEIVPILDTVGELGYLYSLASFAFVGKSLTAAGGHNVLEASALGATPVFGPRTENFEAEVRLLIQADAAEEVNDEGELAQALQKLLRYPELCRSRVERGRKAIEGARGAAERNLDAIRGVLAERPEN